MRVLYVLLVWLLYTVTIAHCGACPKGLVHSRQKRQFGFDLIGGIASRAGDVVDNVGGSDTFGFLGSDIDDGSRIFGGSQGRSAKSAVVFLHGLGPKIQEPLCKALAGGLIGLENNLIRCPLAPAQATGVLPPTMLPFFSAATGGQVVRSWFNFWKMPAQSVLSPDGGESKEQLEESLALIESQIDEVHSQGVPYENIVLSGMSQGGVMTLYYALHGKRKLGALVPIVTWLPLLKKEPPSQLQSPPVNRDTPILHLNGLMDLIVPLIAGSRTSEAMSPVFPNYVQENTIGTHVSTFGPHSRPRIKRFLQQSMPQLQFESGLSSLLPL